MFPDLKAQNKKDIAAAEQERQEQELLEQKTKKDDVLHVGMDNLDPEDRARLLVQQEKPVDGGLLMTVVGMLLAAVVAVYLYF